MGKRFIRAKVLYFIGGVVPTEAQAAQIEELLNSGKDVFQRNATMIREDEAVEAFDELAGNVPANYLDAAGDKTVHEAPEEPEIPAADGSEAPAATSTPAKPEKGAGGAEKPAGAASGWKPNA